MDSNVTTSTRINSSSVHTYICVCFIRNQYNTYPIFNTGFVDPKCNSHRVTHAHLFNTLGLARCMCTWRGNYCFISYLCNLKVQCFTQIYAYLSSFAENTVFGNVIDTSKYAKMLIFCLQCL